MTANSVKKKIIIIGPTYPYRGGNSLFVTYLYHSLINSFEVKIYNYKLLYPSILFPGTTQYDKSEQTITAPSQRIVNSINPFNWFATAAKIKKEKADLIVFDWWHPFFGLCHGVITLLIKKNYKNKILFITENVISHEANFIDKLLTKIGLSNASKFLTLSTVVENDVKQYSKSKKTYRSELPVYDCYQKAKPEDLKKLKDEFNIQNDDLVLLFFGYVRKYKGLDILINAMNNILKIKPNTKLFIVGEFYDSESNYTSQIKNLNLQENVFVINQFVPNEEVAKYYEVSDVVILPYRSATQSGILNVAYGYKKPVIVTRVGGLADFVKEGFTGFVVEPNSATEIADGVNKFLDLRDEVNFSEEIEKYNSNNSFIKINQVFVDILNDSEN